MKHDRHDAWKRHNRNDTLFNGALIAAGILGLLLSAMDAPLPAASPSAQAFAVSGIVLSEIGITRIG